MGNKTQLEQEKGTSTGCIQNRYQYENYNTMKKPSFKSNIAKIKNTTFTQGYPYDAAQYEDCIKTLIN